MFSNEKEYFKLLANIIQEERLRDTFTTQRRLKELNKQYPSDVVIFHSENVRGRCVVYYGHASNPSLVDTYEFKLGKINKNKEIKKLLCLDQWVREFNQTIRNKKPRLEEIELDIMTWVNKFGDKNKAAVDQFITTFKVYYNYMGQLLISYKEFNNEIKKIKPIIRLYEPVSLDELIEFAKRKSKELWNRDFTCKIKIVNRFWKQQLGAYYPKRREILFSEYINAVLPKEKILDTLLHEMVHWHLHTTGRNFGDEDFEFIEECLKIGCGLSHDSKAQKAYLNYKMQDEK